MERIRGIAWVAGQLAAALATGIVVAALVAGTNGGLPHPVNLVATFPADALALGFGAFMAVIVFLYRLDLLDDPPPAKPLTGFQRMELRARTALRERD